ncbi:uncharacterized protein V1510DRAFT_280255 [Dipodascopsis tothii]|uniref:uncharacterized protein n=1 Tax=Dipodascopsis tothii TaxID=44089 RepID=UPI0034CD5DBE
MRSGAGPQNGAAAAPAGPLRRLEPLVGSGRPVVRVAQTREYQARRDPYHRYRSRISWYLPLRVSRIQNVRLYGRSANVSRARYAGGPAREAAPGHAQRAVVGLRGPNADRELPRSTALVAWPATGICAQPQGLTVVLCRLEARGRPRALGVATAVPAYPTSFVRPLRSGRAAHPIRSRPLSSVECTLVRSGPYAATVAGYWRLHGGPQAAARWSRLAIGPQCPSLPSRGGSAAGSTVLDTIAIAGLTSAPTGRPRTCWLSQATRC